ncbi:MAG TPA: hypothetical protein VF802_05345 [Candidatus Limnocylindrales bacterium]
MSRPSHPHRGTGRLHRTPAERVVAALPRGSISLLLTDPAYETVDRRPKSGHLRRWLANSLSWDEIAAVLAAARRALRPEGVAVVMTYSAGLAGALGAMERAGFVRVRPITWDKVSPGLGTGLRHRTEQIPVGSLPQADSGELRRTSAGRGGRPR